ncbi:hypothetical protein BDY21DRAFT_390063 [Lineolata rhizophorae]|uniref:Secreted protein n=1 Tax=Lineolata rhizophorae TaxID=578093 RepID=A0A6A6PEG2_9PEZI|nr:hypothetical protein BDY21DRAFT_390063 [Lineolata rhizophorae]
MSHHALPQVASVWLRRLRLVSAVSVSLAPAPANQTDHHDPERQEMVVRNSSECRNDDALVSGTGQWRRRQQGSSARYRAQGRLDASFYSWRDAPPHIRYAGQVIVGDWDSHWGQHGRKAALDKRQWLCSALLRLQHRDSSPSSHQVDL